jgi:hypothetical protein
MKQNLKFLSNLGTVLQGGADKLFQSILFHEQAHAPHFTHTARLRHFDGRAFARPQG